MKIILTILIVSIIGTCLVAIAEAIFGVTNVFMFCALVTFIVGVLYVPIKQLKGYLNK